MKQTIEILASKNGAVVRVEVPITGVFELRGEAFALITDYDYEKHVMPGWDEEEECCGDLSVTHIGTGCNAGAMCWFADRATAMRRVDELWAEGVDLYKLAESRGFPSARGTILAIDKVEA